MRVFALASAISLLAAAPVQAAPDVRAASLNLCTDELLLMLAAPDQIASVTHLSHDPQESPLWRLARRHPKNQGSLLSVAAEEPAVVIDMGGGGGGDAPRIAKRLGMRLITLPYPESLGDVEASIRTVATVLGRRRAGEALLDRIEQAKRSAPRTATEAIWLGGGGRSLAPTGLGAQWMRLAGLRQKAVAGNRVTIEQLLVSPPALLLRSDYRSGQYSAQQQWLKHPLLRRTGNWKTLATDGRKWTCMGPLLIDEILRLRRAAA
jgi:iron complex transport system substrate-binding protein